MRVGTVSELWLHPVKSMAGYTVDEVSLDQQGVIGDRNWAMLERSTEDIAWGKRFPQLLNLKAAYTAAAPTQRVYGDHVPSVRISFPDGSVADSTSNASEAVSAYIGAPLNLCSLQPPENADHYAWSKPVDEESLMKILGIAPGEAPPDMSSYDEDLLVLLAQYYSPPGTYNDMAPIHMLTTASMAYMEEVAGVSFDARRFRPNFVVETDDGVDGLAEFSWVGKRLQVGEVVLKVNAKTVRCSMPARGQTPHGLDAEPLVSKSLYLETGRFLGAYLSVDEPGRIRSGDTVSLI